MTFEATLLPDSEKEMLARSLLSEFGVSAVRVNADSGEMIHSCILPFGLHKNGDANPSASFNYKKLTYKCLSGDTLIKTFDGEREIGALAGQVVRLLDGDGKWVDAPVKKYGTERLYRVTLSRNGVRQEVYTTADHRWYTRPKGATSGLIEQTTLDLKPRQRIPSVWAMTRTGRTTISPTGVMAGFVYGDGTSTEHGARANFVGDKDAAMLPYFAAHAVKKYDDTAVVLTGLPRSWKALPDLDEGASYLYGWLAGYFAADGCVAEDGHITLACASESTLQFVVALCDRLGIATYTLSGRTRIGRSGEHQATVATGIYSLSFRGSTLTSEFFLLPHHRTRYEAAQQRRTYERTHWWVVSVEATDRVEDVFCAEVPTTSSFVLTGNILTGNCLGCGNGGGLLWFIGTMRGTGVKEARAWVNKSAGIGEVMDLSDLLSYFDALYDKKQDKYSPIPTYDVRVLDPWLAIHPYLTEVRHIPEENIKRMRVGWDPHRDRIIIPHFLGDDLVGWQARRLNPNDPDQTKYRNSPDFPKDQTIYNYDYLAEYAVVVESPMTTLRHLHHEPVEGTFGASVTDRQIRLLSRHPKVILMFDNDNAGWAATAHVGDALMRQTNVFVSENPYAADGADMDDDDLSTLVHEDITPYSIWEPPKHLECYLHRTRVTNCCVRN